MKLVKKADGSHALRMSQDEWLTLGQQNGWLESDTVKEASISKEAGLADLIKRLFSSPAEQAKATQVANQAAIDAVEDLADLYRQQRAQVDEQQQAEKTDVGGKPAPQLSHQERLDKLREQANELRKQRGGVREASISKEAGVGDVLRGIIQSIQNSIPGLTSEEDRRAAEEAKKKAEELSLYLAKGGPSRLKHTVGPQGADRGVTKQVSLAPGSTTEPPRSVPKPKPPVKRPPLRGK